MPESLRTHVVEAYWRARVKGLTNPNLSLKA